MFATISTYDNMPVQILANISIGGAIRDGVALVKKINHRINTKTVDTILSQRRVWIDDTGWVVSIHPFRGVPLVRPDKPAVGLVVETAVLETPASVSCHTKNGKPMCTIIEVGDETKWILSTWGNGPGIVCFLENYHGQDVFSVRILRTTDLSVVGEPVECGTIDGGPGAVTASWVESFGYPGGDRGPIEE